MELKLEGESKSVNGMKKCHKTMLNIFGNHIELVKYGGPVQMCVFYLEYQYYSFNYKIIIECERGFITLKVKDKDNNTFSPWMIFPEARYYHFQDVDKDVSQLIELTYKAIEEQKIEFLTSKKMERLWGSIQWN